MIIMNLNNTKRSIVTLAGLLLALFSLQPLADPSAIQKLIADNELDQALSMTEAELENDGSNVSYRFMKGLILTRLNKLEQARDVFVALTQSNPDLPEPYNNLAVIYASMGDYDKARQALEQAINTHPAYATAHENLGDIYAKLASQAYNQALELDNNNTTAKTKLTLVNELFAAPASVGDQPVQLAEAQAAEQEAAKREVERQELARAEDAKQEAARQQQAKVEAAKQEAARQQQPKWKPQSRRQPDWKQKGKKRHGVK